MVISFHALTHLRFFLGIVYLHISFPFLTPPPLPEDVPMEEDIPATEAEEEKEQEEEENPGVTNEDPSMAKDADDRAEDTGVIGGKCCQ